MKAVLDTNIFNRLADGAATSSVLPAGLKLVVTHVQLDELNQTKDVERRGRLLLCFAILQPEVIPTESFVLGISRLDHGKLSDGKLIETIRRDLDDLNGGKQNNWQDALIAEVALVNGYVLVTADADLHQVAQAHGGLVHRIK